MFFRCGRGACGWSFIVGFASGVGGGGLLFFVCFPFAAIFVFMLVSNLVFESISFRGFYCGPLPGVDSGPLPVHFCWCPPPCPGGCLCTIRVYRNTHDRFMCVREHPRTHASDSEETLCANSQLRTPWLYRRHQFPINSITEPKFMLTLWWRTKETVGFKLMHFVSSQ